MKKFLLSCALATLVISGASATINIKKADREIAAIEASKETPAPQKVKEGDLIEGENFLIYQIIDNIAKTCGVVRYDFRNTENTLEDVVIPEKITVDGVDYTVVQIGAYAFQWAAVPITITLPETIEVIEDSAFMYCSRLQEMEIPENCKYVGKYAFYFCTDLRRVVLPKHIDTIWEACFANCTSLREIEIPESVQYIDEIAFHHCNSLKEMRISKNVIDITNNPFGDCWEMKGIYVDPENPVYCDVDGVLYSKDKKVIRAYTDGHGETYSIIDGTEEIGPYAFYYAEWLSEITLPESVTRIGEGAFFCANEFQQITIPKGVKEIGSGAFYKATSLKRIDVDPENQYYKSVNGSVYNKKGTVYINFPCGRSGEYDVLDGVTAVADFAFAGASELVTVNLPESCELIGPAAFAQCRDLQTVNMPGVTEIFDQAFYYCFYLKTVVLPYTLKVLGDEVYKDDLRISLIVCQSPKPPVCGKQVFDTTLEGMDCTVIIGAKDAYMKSSTFSHFTIHEDMYMATAEYNKDGGTVDINKQGDRAFIDIYNDTEVTFTPAAGSKVVSVTVNDKDYTSEIVGDKLFIAPMEANLTIKVVFAGAGVNGLDAEEAVEVEYYDINGLKVFNPERGVFIKAEKSNGVTKYTKVVK